jgi:hypothetical protein
MAVTKIWRIKGNAANTIDYASNPEKTAFTDEERQALADVIEYASNEDKTEKKYFVSAVNCSVPFAKDQFNTTKKRFRKEDGTVAFHAYQSFAEGEATPQKAHDIGVSLARELWGDRFQVVVATHLNTSCLHNHFVINSVSFKDGKRFHSTAESYRTLRETSDRLCREYGLSIVETPEGKGLSYKHYQMEKAGMPTRYNVAKNALDEAISKSCNLHELKANLKSMGYQCQFAQNRKYWTITLPGWKKPIRTYRLGEEYSRENIEKRVYENNDVARSLRMKENYKRSPQYSLKRRIDKIMGRSGLEKLYLRYCYELGYLPRYNQNSSKVNALLKDDLLRCDMYSEEAKLLARHHIASKEELEAYRISLTKTIDGLEEKRDSLRLAARRKIPEDERSMYRQDAAEITGKLKALRKELKLVDDIATRSPTIEGNVEKLDKEKTKEVHR